MMSRYLTPHILSAERMEMAQCLYFVASKAESNTIEIIGVYFMFEIVNEI